MEKNIRNDLLKRQEISFILESGQNPGFSDVKREISEKFKAGEELIAVNQVKGSFGSRKFRVSAYVYDTKEGLEKARQLTKKQKEALKKAEEEKKKAEEEKPAEKPAEEAKIEA